MLKVHQPLLLGTIGAILGLAIVLPGIEIEQAMRPFFLIWLFLVCLQTGFWTIVFWPMSKAVKELWIRSAEQFLRFGLPVAAIILLMVIQFAAIVWLFPSDREPPFERFQISLFIITGLGFVLSLLGTWMVLLIGYRIEHNSKELNGNQEDYDSHVRLQDQLHRSILVLGTIIGLATLAAGALRNLQIQHDPDFEALYPPEFQLIYGAFYTVVLALIAVPTYVSLLEVGTKIRDAQLPPPSIESDSWSDVHARRRQFDEVFQLSFNSSRNFRYGVAVLSPFIGSVISILIA